MLFTIGYESKSIDDFISKLKNNDISILVDVREIPISRKNGFSKNIFSEHLNKNGIEYIHLKKLGSPKNIRKELKQNQDCTEPDVVILIGDYCLLFEAKIFLRF